MTCEAVARYLDLYLDRELAVEECGQVETHLAGCEGCRRAATIETRFRAALRDALCDEHAPRSLHEQVRVRLRSERVHTTPRWAPRMAVAAGVAFVAAGAWFAFGPTQDSIDPAQRLLADYEAASGSEVEGDAVRVASFLQERSPFRTRLPIAEREGLRLIGAQIKRWDDTPVVVYRYEMNGKRFLVAQYPSTAQAGESRLRIDDRPGYVVASYRDGDLAHTLIGDVPPSVVPSVIPATYDR